MVECPYAENWKNLEGYFVVTHCPEDHPWYGKTFCMDWDAQCTLCLEEENATE